MHLGEGEQAQARYYVERYYARVEQARAGALANTATSPMAVMVSLSIIMSEASQSQTGKPHRHSLVTEA